MSKYPSLICILVGGPIIRIATNHGTVGFEWHNYFGPTPVSLKRGHEGDECSLPPKHDFWNKVTLWAQGGMKVENGWAIIPATAPKVKP